MGRWAITPRYCPGTGAATQYAGRLIHMDDPVAGGTAYWMDDGTGTGPIAAQD
jgi:hypothetical protein